MGNVTVGELAEAGSGTALVTVVSVRGSSPRHAGSRMLVKADGSFSGTVGGGKGEFLALSLARSCIAEKRNAMLEVEMTGAEAEGPVLICGGTSLMLVEYLADLEPYRKAASVLKGGGRVALVKRFGKPGETFPEPALAAVLDEGGVPLWSSLPAPDIDGEAGKRCLASGVPEAWPETGLFYGPEFPGEKLLILGGGHVGRALAFFACRLGFEVTVADDREEFARAEDFPAGTATIAGAFAETIGSFPFDGSTYAVILTRGHLCDLECLRAILGREYRYAGLIGSARKSGMLFDQAIADGFPPEKVRAVHSPVGLPIGAETPEEIAVSILAEMVAVRRKAARPERRQS